jgi:hypothetical protein
MFNVQRNIKVRYVWTFLEKHTILKMFKKTWTMKNRKNILGGWVGV